MSLALVAGPAAARAFDSDFYVTAASVIPVLFLAVALQSQFQQDLVATVFRLARRLMYARVPVSWRPAIQTTAVAYLIGVGAILAGFLIAIITAFGVIGEILAIVALASQNSAAAWLPGVGVQAVVRDSVVFLAVVVGVTSTLPLARFAGRSARALLRLGGHRRTANGAPWRDVWLAGAPRGDWREHQIDVQTFPVVWRPDAPDDGGFSDPVITVSGHVFSYVSPASGVSVADGSRDFARGGRVTVADATGRVVGAGALVEIGDPGRAIHLLDEVKAESGTVPGVDPGLTSAELIASGTMYGFTLTAPWLVGYWVTAGQGEAMYVPVASMMSVPLLTFIVSRP
jgi:hypothetical protein